MEEFCYGKQSSGSGMEEFSDSKAYQVLVWENFVLVRVIRFWYGRILL